ncbi:M20 family metallo-hydrolase [Streptomyces sp. NPDC004237]|uniref:M20 family metallo-hydrolase n=1 Tax=Streptomyces sp. NPDC004237 TaxID=3154455 RepID=UPI0033AB6EE7
MSRDIQPSAERIWADIEALSKITDPALPGWTRQALTQADVDGRHRVRESMQQAGMETWIDTAGNVIGVLAGTAGGGRQLMLGSHTDTVEGGGRFDGVCGVVGAIEVVRALREADRRLRHDLVVVDFFSEEPNHFGLSCVGSRAMTGALGHDALGWTDSTGVAFADVLPKAGIDPARIGEAVWDFSKVTAFLELHVEQGPHLEELGTQIGLVETITGVSRFRALFHGQSDHAGTTPMSRRHDAGCAAAGTVLAVERIASGQREAKGTVGSLTFTPEAVNVVTRRAEMRGEFRSPDGTWLRHAEESLTRAAATQAAGRGVTVHVEWSPRQEPAALAGGLLGTVADAVDGLGLSRSTLYSGAEHDAAVLARRVPTAMLFVPSRDGRSHCAEEFTDPADITAGVTALAESVLRVDAAGGTTS